MASKWLRMSSVLLRASRPGLAYPRQVQLSSLRWASAAAAPSPESQTKRAPAIEETSITDALPEFSSLQGKVNPALLKALTVSPFKLKNMSAVQAQVLPMLPGLASPTPTDERADLLVRAKTGTGKTIGFLVPAVEARLNQIRHHGKQAVADAGLVTDAALEVRARKIFARTQAGSLIISPTRELATQIANEAIRLTQHLEGVETRLFVGGVSKRMQMRDWMKGRRDIVVGTPGRIRDLLESEPEVAKGLRNCPMLILDEADTLLEMGFREDITAISDCLAPKPERQTFLFSATVSREIQQVAKQVLSPNHKFINCVSSEDSPVHAHVPQYHTVLPSAAHQIPHLLRLIAHDQLSNPGKSKIIMFLPTTKMTQLFATFVRELGKTLLPSRSATTVYELHSKRTQDSRSATSNRFRNDRSGASILVSSDVSARGVDYPGVTRVIQVGIPGGTDQYIHRVGRTGRGRDGHGRADLVLLPWEIGFVSWQLTHIPLKPLTVNELTNQTKALADQFDADPAAVMKGASFRGDAFKSPYAPFLADFEKEIGGLLEQLDPDAIKETMASLLGYYFGKAPELRIQKPVILQGLRDWTTEACGLPHPPHISEAFLAKIGLTDGRTKHWGKDAPKQPYGTIRRSDSPHWMGRGNVRARNDRGSESRYGEKEYSPFRARSENYDSDLGDPKEYRGSRYRY